MPPALIPNAAFLTFTFIIGLSHDRNSPSKQYVVTGNDMPALCASLAADQYPLVRAARFKYERSSNIDIRCKALIFFQRARKIRKE